MLGLKIGIRKVKNKIIGINASRGRSGGAKAHLIGILSALNPQEYGIEKVHVWAYKELLGSLPNVSWLIKHDSSYLQRSIIYQLWWEYCILPKELKQNDCEILFNIDAGSICPFLPCVTMSQDMLPFDAVEIKRYKLSSFFSY